MENVQGRLDIRLLSSVLRVEQLIAKCNLLDHTIYNENLVIIKMAKTKMVLNKRMYLRQCILDTSKINMYDFH